MLKKVRNINAVGFLQAMFLNLIHEIVIVLSSFLIFVGLMKLSQFNFLSIYLLNVFWVIWLSVSISVGIFYFLTNSYRYIYKGLFFRPSPIIPSLVLGVSFIFIEILSSAFILFILKRYYSLSVLWVTLIFVFIILFFEIIFRFSDILKTFKKITSILRGFIHRAINWIYKSWSLVIYWVLSFLFIGFSYMLIYKGYLSPLNNQPEFAKELFSNVLTIVTAILAIFFGATTLIVQLIVGIYSYKFVKVLFKSQIFVTSFLLYLLIGIFHLVFLWRGWNSYLVTFSFVSSIYVLLSLVILVIHFADWIQAPYVIDLVAKDIQKYIFNNKISKKKTNRLNTQPGIPSIKFRIRSYYLAAFLGEEYKNPYLEEVLAFTLSPSVQEKIIEDTRPLLTACLKAINEDRREIVLACLNGIDITAKTYINKFDNSIITTDDRFMMFLYDQLSILYEAAVDSRNQQFTLDIVKCAIEIAKSCLVLTRDIRENNHIFIWVEFLQESIIKSLHLERTAAQMTACTGIIDIGKSLIEQTVYSTALNINAEALHKIGKTVGSIKHTWTAAIAARVSNGLVELMTFYVIKVWKSNIYDGYFIDDVCKKILSVLDISYRNQNSDYFTISSLTNSVVGRNSGFKLIGIVSIILHGQNESSQIQHNLLSKIREIIFLLSKLSFSAQATKSYAIEDYISTLSEIGYKLIKFISDKNKGLDIAKKDIKLLITIAENLWNGVIENDPNNSYECINELSFLYASLIFYSNNDEEGFFLNLYTESVSKMMEKINTLTKKKLDTHGYRLLYSYINLFGAWLFHFNPKLKDNKKIKTFIRRNSFLEYPLESSNYPDYFTSNDRIFLGATAWRHEGHDILNVLKSQEIYFNYDKYLVRK